MSGGQSGYDDSSSGGGLGGLSGRQGGLSGGQSGYDDSSSGGQYGGVSP